MKILLLGSEGNIGKPLCSHLRKQGHEVFRFDLLPGYSDDYMMGNINSGIELEEAFCKNDFDVCYALAAVYGRIANERYFHNAIETNFVGLANTIHLCEKHKVKLLFTSSSEAYGDIGGLLHEGRTDLKPNNRYGILKLMGEQLIQYEIAEHGLDAVILRPNMIYTETEETGVYRSALIQFCENLLNNKGVVVHQNSHRSWLHISDACEVFEQAMTLLSGTIMNVAHFDQVETLQVANWLCAHLKLDPSKYITVQELPNRMTLNKPVSTTKMYSLMGSYPKIHIEQGCISVLESVKKRLEI